MTKAGAWRFLITLAFFHLIALLLLTSCAPKQAAPAANSCQPLAGAVTALSEELAAGTKLSVSLRDACANPGQIAAQISNRFEGVTPSGVRSYDWELNRSMSRAELERLAKADPCVESIGAGIWEVPRSPDVAPDAEIGPNEFIPDDPKASQELHLNAMGASEAFDIFFNPKSGIKKDVVIAVIDSGVRTDHEDLRDRLWTNSREIPRNGIDDDRNGYVDDVHGYNFASQVADPNPQKTSANGAWEWAHGTRVAGLAAATSGNRKGVTGIAPNARIMALNAMGTAAGFSQTTMANAIRYAVDNGARVINLSIGGNSGQSAAYSSAIQYAISRGVAIFAAAGNESSAIGSSYSAAGLSPYYAGLVSIGNYQAADFKKSPTSNYSTSYVKLGAPGTYNSSTRLLTTSPESSTSYSYFSGTSAAAPVASGAAALAIGLLETRGYRATPALVESVLLESARKLSTLSAYFRNGNALHLGNLARYINAKYPARSPDQNQNGQEGDEPSKEQSGDAKPDPVDGTRPVPAPVVSGACS